MDLGGAWGGGGGVCRIRRLQAESEDWRGGIVFDEAECGLLVCGEREGSVGVYPTMNQLAEIENIIVIHYITSLLSPHGNKIYTSSLPPYKLLSALNLSQPSFL